MKKNIVKPSYMYNYMEDRNLINGIYGRYSKNCHYEEEDTDRCVMVSIETLKIISSEKASNKIVVDNSSFMNSPVDVMFSIIGDCDWLSLTDYQNKGVKYVQLFNVKENFGDERTCEIIAIQTGFCSHSIKFKITQKSMHDSCILKALTRTDISISKNGRNYYELKVQSSYFNTYVPVNFSIAENSDNSGWIELVEGEKIDPNNFTSSKYINVKRNEGYSVRKCVILAKQYCSGNSCGCNKEILFTITQKSQQADCYFEIKGNKVVESPYEGYSGKIEIESKANGNMYVDVSYSSNNTDWINFGGESIYNTTYTVPFSIKPNNSKYGRNTEIKFTQDSMCGGEIIVYFYQKGKNEGSCELYIEPSRSDEFEYSGGTGTFTVKSSHKGKYENVKVEPYDNWININDKLVDSENNIVKISYSVDTNYSSGKRSGNIGIWQTNNCSGNELFQVNQKGSEGSCVLEGPKDGRLEVDASSHNNMTFDVISSYNGYYAPIKAEANVDWINGVTSFRLANTNKTRVSFSISKNPNIEARDGKISVTSECGNYYTYNIHQKSSNDSYSCEFIVDNNTIDDNNNIVGSDINYIEYTVGKWGDYFDLVVNDSSYNDEIIPVEFIINGDAYQWIELSGQHEQFGTLGFIQRLKISQNDGNMRDGSITIRQKSGQCNKEVEIRIKQRGVLDKCVLYADSTTYVIRKNNGCVLSPEYTSFVIKQKDCILSPKYTVFYIKGNEECILNIRKKKYDLYQNGTCFLSASRLVYDIKQENNCVLKANKNTYDITQDVNCVLKANKNTYDITQDGNINNKK